MVGIAEWAFDIPMAFRLLLTGKPRTSVSSIWEVPEKIAIFGDYAAGVDRLLAELDNHPDARATSMRDEADAFLNDPAVQRKYLVLECGEIFEMEDTPLEDQAKQLLEEILSLPQILPRAKPPARAGFFAGLFGGRAKNTSEIDWDTYGLGNWSTVLYHNPSATDDDDPSTG